jgi:hypothetical protein
MCGCRYEPAGAIVMCHGWVSSSQIPLLPFSCCVGSFVGSIIISPPSGGRQDSLARETFTKLAIWDSFRVCAMIPRLTERHATQCAEQLSRRMSASTNKQVTHRERHKHKNHPHIAARIGKRSRIVAVAGQSCCHRRIPSSSFEDTTNYY